MLSFNAIDAPKDRRFLARNEKYNGDGRGNWTFRGHQWIEAFWDKEDRAFRIWTGNYNTRTTESLKFTRWAERPE